MKNWKNSIIAIVISLSIVAIVGLIGHLLNFDAKFLAGWFGASGYFVTLNLLEDEKM